MDKDLTPEAAAEAVSLFKSQKGNPIEWDWLGALWDWLKRLWAKLWALAAEAAEWVWSYVGPWLTGIWDWLVSVAANIAQFFTYLWNTVSDIVSSWVTKVWSWLQEGWAKTAHVIWEWVSKIWDWLESLWLRISDAFTSLGIQITHFFTELPRTIERTIVDPLVDWFRDVADAIRSVFGGMYHFLRTWLYEFPMWMIEDFPERVIYGLTTSFEWLGKWGERFAGNLIEAILGYVQKVGRVDPTNAPTIAGGLMSLMGAGIMGLAAMTIAGEFMNPLSHLGMGHVSAMIGDVVNYKVISGAFMGALVGAALSTPLRYYFNYTLRPWLPGAGEIAECMSRDLFIDPESLNPELAPGIKDLVGPDGGVAFEKRLLGYRGFHDEYYPVFKELASSRIGYFALAAIARSGVFDEEIFTSEMMRAGYWPRARTMLIDMYRRDAAGELKPIYTGVAIDAFKEGWFLEPRLRAELTELGIPTANHDRYVHAAWLKYEVDLLSDRLAGLKEAYRKGLVTDSEFSGSLTAWGMADERATEHLRREQIRRYGTL